jgi:hypothetical protein
MAEVVPNANGIRSGRLLIVAANQPYQFPDITVPDDMYFVIKAGPLNAGIINVGGSGPDVRGPEGVWPLLPQENVGYRVKNAQSIYCSGTVAGDFAYYTVEQRK